MVDHDHLLENEDEAIEVIQSNIPTSGYYILKEACEMAMKALKEIQAYRKIGTVKEFESLKTQFQRHSVDNTFCQFRNCNKCDSYRIENEKYHEIGTVEECQKAVDKQTPIPPRKIGHDEFYRSYCPVCHALVGWGRVKKHCENCGQSLTGVGIMINATKLNHIKHCLKVLAEEEVCEECELYNIGHSACKEVAQDALSLIDNLMRSQNPNYLSDTYQDATKAYIDQLKWERDIAIQQLQEIGIGLGQKMDDVKNAIEKQQIKKLEPLTYEPLVQARWRYKCPTCGAAAGENIHHSDVTKDYMHCDQCGQRIEE